MVIVTPALASANNGNWQTAQRWARMLQPAYRVRLADRWDGGDEDLLIALHARRSAAAVAAWRERAPRRPLCLVLTGTDLYRDIDTDATAQASLAAADTLVVLNTLGARQLPAPLRAKCRVVLQSCAGHTPVTKTARHLRVLMVGHLRDEKDPRTYWSAARRLAGRADIRLDHIGAALDPALGDEAAALSAAQPNFCWLGGRTHGETLRRIRSAHLLVHASRMEGGAHVVIEAVRAGTPVLASAIDGNLGLLGDDWPATFPVGDDARLAALIAQARDDPAMLPRLARAAAARAPLFAPEAERAAVCDIAGTLLAGPTTGTLR